jgi:hypothetical protein
MTINRALKVLALVCFVLAVFGIGGVLGTVPLGLACYVAADLA